MDAVEIDLVQNSTQKTKEKMMSQHPFLSTSIICIDHNHVGACEITTLY